MSGPRFAHLTGRRMWERCDHAGTRIEGTPAAVTLAPRLDGDDRPAFDAADYAAWQAVLGSATVLPCAPDRCDAATVVLARPGAALAMLTPDGWQPQAVAAPASPAIASSLDFAPLQPPPAPASPDAIAADPAGRLWLLDRPGRSLRLLAPDFHIQATVALPPDIDPGFLGCSAFGLVVTDRASPRLVVQPWGGAWRGYAVPVASGAHADIVALAADPAFPAAVALVKGPDASWRLMYIGADGVAIHPLPLAVAPLQLLLTAADTLLVGEVAHRPGDPRPHFFREYVLKPTGPEAERGYAVRRFDGRALWLSKGDKGTQIMASTAAGARALYPREPALEGSGVVETWALDSGIFGCVWHRLFADLCLPADCAIGVEAKTADDLPPFDIRRGARLPVDQAGDTRPAPADDPWPPLGSLIADETEGWVRLGVADPRPAHADLPLADSVAERPSQDPLAELRQPQTTWPSGMRSHEFLIAAPPGRYLWLRIRLSGTRSQGPALFALRATFPRPSLLDYLPAYWRSDPEGADSTERALALFEGWMTELDQRTDVLPTLVDPRLVPADALPWLASFLALTFDARVREGVRRQLLVNIATLYRQRGTVPGLTQLLGILAEAPVQIIEGFRLRRPTAAFVGTALVGSGLEIGGSESTLGFGGAEGWEQELAREHTALLLRRANQSAPCPSRTPDDPLPDDALIAFYRHHAHRFTVIVPRACDATLGAVLELALEANKPAHTLHRLCWLDAGYRVGSASLVGISHIGPIDRPTPAVLGSAVLSTFTTLHRGRREDRYPYFKPMNPWEASP